MRRATAAAHAELEAIVGPIDSAEAYTRYARGLYAGRAPLEAALRNVDWPASLGGWRPLYVAALLAQDLADLGVDRPALAVHALSSDPADLLGTLYVLEGSALGARLLYGQARALGLSAQHGARHLAAQAASPTWGSFLNLLESVPGLDMARTGRAARDAFAAMGLGMTEVRHAAA